MPVYTDNLARNPRIRTPNDGIARDPMPYSWPFAPPIASYSRSSVAYDWNGNSYASGVPRYLPNKYGNTYYAEEGTTNLLTANQSHPTNGTTGLAVVGTNAPLGTISQVASPSWLGGGSAQIVVSGWVSGDDVNLATINPSTGIEPTAIAVSASTTYTLSAHVLGPSSAGWYLRCIQWNSNGGVVSDTHAGGMTANGAWQYETYTLTTASTTAYISLRVWLGGNGTWNFDGLQVEQKAYATTWITGGSTRSPEQLSYTLPQPLPTVWGGVLWHVSDYASSVSSGFNPTYLWIKNSPTGAWRYLVDLVNGDARLQSQDASGTIHDLLSSGVSWSAGQIVFYAWLVDPVAGQYTLWVGVGGGALQSFSLPVTAQITDAQYVYIGNRNVSVDGDWGPDGTLGDVQIYGGRNWVSQIPLIYASGSPAPWLPDSIDIRPLNGTFAGVSNPATSGIQIG